MDVFTFYSNDSPKQSVVFISNQIFSYFQRESCTFSLLFTDQAKYIVVPDWQ